VGVAYKITGGGGMEKVECVETMCRYNHKKECILLKIKINYDLRCDKFSDKNIGGKDE
jgi:hypothetical protein